MSSFRLDPYLWVHLAGLAAAPLFLELVWWGLSLGDPLPFPILELVLVALVGLLPIFWMQWNKPFSIYSLVFLSLKSDALTVEQKQVLTLFKQPVQRLLTISLTGAMLLVLWLIYQQAPLASSLAEQFLPLIRVLGLLIAAINFLLANLFVQVPLSALLVLLTSPEKFNLTTPWEIEKISQDFTVIGWKVKQILQPLK